MPDVWVNITAVDDAMQERLAGVLETRSADPQQQALRVLRPGSWLAVFDGDDATTTVALGDHDPLQACVNIMMANSVTDRWLMRRLPQVVRDCGFVGVDFRSHGFVESGGGYMLTVVERGVDFLRSFGQIGDDTAAARRRIEADTFFGLIAYASVTARKPA